MMSRSAMVVEKRENLPDPATAIIALTRHGVALALKIQARLEGSVCYVPSRYRFALSLEARGFDQLSKIVPSLWNSFKSLVFIMSTGIVVRLIGPLVRDKMSDPAVVVLDERGRYVISLLSGHWGGANHLATRVAQITGGDPVITTASDVQQKPAIDLIARHAGLEIENRDMLSRVAGAIVDGETIWVYDPHLHLQPFLKETSGLVWLREDEMVKYNEQRQLGIWVSECLAPPGFQCLLLRPKNLVVGLGCNRGTEVAELSMLIQKVFANEALSLLSIRNLATVDLKEDEPAIKELGRKLSVPVEVYTRSEIAKVAVPNPSNVVKKHIGVESVCEASALISAKKGTLLVPKQKSLNATLAVARVESPS